MIPRRNVVSIHPWFKIHAGKLSEAKAILPRLIELSASIPGCLYYDFTLNRDRLFCREAYASADAALAHVQGVTTVVAELLQISDLDRIEVHGSTEELAKMRGPMKDTPVEWFVFEIGMEA